MKVCRLDDLDRLLAENPHQVIAQAEAEYEQKILDAAVQIRDHSAERPIVLLSGPSGSGKTTTALRIEKLLDSWGCETHTLSMDNYFYGHTQGAMPLDDDGKVDLESPLRLDVPLLEEHLDKIARCIPVEIPTFDFASQQRGPATIPLHRHPGELVILEGIHALNPQVTGRAGEYSTGVYVSVRTRVQAADGALLHPEKLRLCRRLLRDVLYRGQSYEDTISRLRSVSRGERLYIMPYKNRAQIAIDTFLPYEIAVYAGELAAGIEAVYDGLMERENLSDLKPFLRQTVPLSKELVPSDSLIREFIGDLKL